MSLSRNAGAYRSSPSPPATPLCPCGDPRPRGTAAPHERGIPLPFNLPAATLKPRREVGCRAGNVALARVFAGHLQSPRWPPLASPGASKIDLDGRFVTGHFVRATRSSLAGVSGNLSRAAELSSVCPAKSEQDLPGMGVDASALCRHLRKIERNVTHVTSCPWCRALSWRKRVASGRVSWMEI